MLLPPAAFDFATRLSVDLTASFVFEDDYYHLALDGLTEIQLSIECVACLIREGHSRLDITLCRDYFANEEMTDISDPFEPRLVDHVITPLVFFEPSIEFGKATFGNGVMLIYRSCLVRANIAARQAALSVISGTSDFDRSIKVQEHLSAGRRARKKDWQLYPGTD